jgi:6-phospho-beta-glucosidase
LTDIDPERLGVMAGLTERMVRHAGCEVAVYRDTQLERMLDGADFVITQIRVGGMKARYLDESIPLKYGIIGQETTGPGGMFKALRTIPPMLDIARKVTEVCPEAFILNYTNPSGIITEAVTKHTRARLIGLCSGIPGMQRRLLAALASRYSDLKTYCVGLNHFGFVHRMVSGGRDVTREAIEALFGKDGPRAADVQTAQLCRLIGAVPISYVNYYFHRGRRLAEVKSAPLTRAQQVERIEREILREAASSETVAKPKALSKRGGGGYADITFSVLKAILNDTGAELPANVPNRGAVAGIEEDAVVEVVCRMDRRGATPLSVGRVPLAFAGLVQAIKAYETLTVEAAVRRSRSLAVLALLNHPLAGDLDVIEPLVCEMLEAHGLTFD